MEFSLFPHQNSEQPTPAQTVCLMGKYLFPVTVPSLRAWPSRKISLKLHCQTVTPHHSVPCAYYPQKVVQTLDGPKSSFTSLFPRLLACTHTPSLLQVTLSKHPCTSHLCAICVPALPCWSRGYLC